MQKKGLHVNGFFFYKRMDQQKIADLHEPDATNPKPDRR
jgi:hypothetical protein